VTQDQQTRERENLARMSRQIAEFFRTLPPDEAAAQIADHINQFWSTSMRRDLRLLFSANSPELHALVRQAWGAIRFPSS
jgi:formate dehydrogenase subunit delta